MRRMLTAIMTMAVAAMLLPTVVLAIDPPVENGVGIMCVFTNADPALAANVLNPVPTGAPVDLYFVFYHPQENIQSIGGVEFGWELNPAPAVAPLVLGITYPTGSGALNIGTNTNLIVGFGNGVPMQGSDHVLLLTMQLFFSVSPGVTEMFLIPADPASIPGRLAYNAAPSGVPLLAMDPNSVDGLMTNPVFGFNEDVAVQGESWSNVKALFR